MREDRGDTLLREVFGEALRDNFVKNWQMAKIAYSTSNVVLGVLADGEDYGLKKSITPWLKQRVPQMWRIRKVVEASRQIQLPYLCSLY